MKKKLWFRSKRYGWGWEPATWEGWLVILVYIAFTVWYFRDIDTLSVSGGDTIVAFYVPFLLSTALLIYICWKTGEKPRWRWGK